MLGSIIAQMEAQELPVDVLDVVNAEFMKRIS